MLAPLLYVKFKAGHIVSAKCVFEKLYLQFWVMKVCCIVNARVAIALCHCFVPRYLLCFSKVTLLLFIISD